ncbi:MAG: hypothetical protein COB30_004900 [Ectothiorhodospiraceae bacterium]|nr:hypothetical protein [Ectothiorhodospiraceae bacterium]MBN4053042.1 hypothetical protein [Gammaproteobacteria bacterium AH-315-K14]
MIYRQTGFVSRTTLFVFFGVSGFLVLAFMLLPKGFNDDVTQIGKGKAAAVLMHDKGSMKSLDLMTLLNTVRSDYTDKIDFFVINVNVKKGETFRQKQDVGTMIIVLFSPDGRKLGTFGNSDGEVELRALLDKLSLEKR